MSCFFNKGCKREDNSTKHIYRKTKKSCSQKFLRIHRKGHAQGSRFGKVMTLKKRIWHRYSPAILY